MKQITPGAFDPGTLNASLQRLGVVELEERMEFSPLLLEAGLQHGGEASPNSICCVCKIPPLDPVPEPVIDLGSTGPTSGVWGR